MFVWNMKLSFGERQPFRIWFDYLKTCLNNELDRKIDRKFYKDWHLTSVKTQKFDTWYKTHEHLFTDTSTTMKISNGTKSSNSILLEVPLNYSITKVQREVGKVLGNKLNKRLSKFAITSNRHLILPPLDYFLYAYTTKRDNPKNLTLEDIWGKVNEHIKKRQNKFVGKISIKKLVEQGKLRQRKQQGWGREPQTGKSGKLIKPKNKAIMISRNILKAQKILQNVCIGQFPGQYSDH